MTHTPASAPLVLETTPSISSLLIFTVAFCCAVRHAPNATAAQQERRINSAVRMLHLLKATNPLLSGAIRVLDGQYIPPAWARSARPQASGQSIAHRYSSGLE